MNKRRVIHIIFLQLIAFYCSAKEINLVQKGACNYKIIVPAQATKLETHSATVLQNYLLEVCSVEIKIENEGKGKANKAIYIGNTKASLKKHTAKLDNEAYLFMTDDECIYFMGGGKGLVYGIYTFIENYLGCRKYGEGKADCGQLKDVNVPCNIDDYHMPQFEYREVYYPSVHNAEYKEWHKLNQLDDLWGLWGHSYDKLVPAKTYFKQHPEYYALVKGKRQATQLCLANEEVFNIVVAELKKRIADNPDATYWSVSPNDDNGYCECEKCKAIDNEQGSQAGSLVKFVNRVAAKFPDQKFTTLAYGYSHRAPKSLKPAANVYIFLSDIDAYRDKPLSEEGTAASFRKDLKEWTALTPNIFVWDYVTEFTNYLAPFPNFHTLQANMKYFKEKGVKGVFIQGSGDTYSEWAELRCYLLAKLLWNDTADVKQMMSQYFKTQFLQAAKFMEEYINELEVKRKESKRKLDIYGNPINEWNSYLTPELMEKYSANFDNDAIKEQSTIARIGERIVAARLPLEYTVLQQARFYGIEKHGIFIKDDNGEWVVKPNFKEKVARFVADCKRLGVTELNEAGLKPDQYQQQWDSIFKHGVTPTKTLGATVTLKNPSVEDYAAKGTKTLVDGNPGYDDFSYNWLCFYGNPMVATIDLGKAVSVTNVMMHFLDDPRHWIFQPETIEVEFSKDGDTYYSEPKVATNSDDEHYNLTIKEFRINNDKHKPVRYIRVTANPIKSLPEWRFRENKKPMIACDEIYVQ